MKIKMDYDRTGLEVEINHAHVVGPLEIHAAEPVADPVAAIAAKLASPTGTPPLAELAAGRFFPREATREDDRLDLVVTLTFPLISGTVLAASSALCAWAWPQHRGALAHWPWWGMVAVLLVADDLTQYLWHRLSHTSVLWPLHRAHHSAAYMSVRVVYRNNALYYALMPGLWLSGGLLYLRSEDRLVCLDVRADAKP